MRTRLRAAASGCFLLSLCAGHAALAQEINYGALAEMFGEPVTTSATGSPQTESQVPADMQIISADQIRQSGAQTIPDILSEMAGIDVRRYSTLDAEVAVRGYAQPFNPRLLVLVNGRQVYSDDYGYTAWETIPVPLGDIRQIEIVRGPASALFGFNAAAGVVNIITYDPLFDKTSNLTISAGTDGTYQGALVTTLSEPGKAGVTVSLNGLKTNEYAPHGFTTAGAAYNPAPQTASYDVDARAKPTATTEVTIEITQNSANATGMSPSDLYERTDYRDRSFKVSLADDSPIGILTLNAYQNQNRNRFFSDVNGNDNFQNQISVIQASDLFKPANAHALRVAVEYRNNREWGEFFNGALSYQDYAASLMWNWQTTPELAFTAAGRIDHLVLRRTDLLSALNAYTLADYNHATLTEPTFNLGLVYQPGASDTIRLLTGRAVQAPSLLDFGLDVPIQFGPYTVHFSGDPYLKAAVTTNYELDYDRSLPSISSTLKTALFYNVTQDILASGFNTAFLITAKGLAGIAANVGHGESQGAEIGIIGASDTGYRWNLSYSLVGVHAHLTERPPTASLEYTNSTPASIIDFGAGYTTGKWELDLHGHWQSRYEDLALVLTPIGPLQAAHTIKNYVTLTGRIGYQVTSQLSLAVTGQDLTSPRLSETSGLEPERRVLLTAAYDF